MTELHTGELVSTILEVIPNIIFIEISEFEKEGNEIMAEEIIHVIKKLKNTNSIGSVATVAIFSSYEEREKYQYIFSSGFNYGVVKSDDILPYNDISYIIGSNDFAFPQYAKAKFNNIAYKAKMQIDIEKVDATNITIASDVELEEYEDDIEINIFEDYNITKYEKIRKEGYSFNSSNLFTYALKIPFAGPFDEITTESIFPSTIETWIQLNHHKLNECQCTMLIISQDISLSTLTYKIRDELSIETYYTRKIDEDRNQIIETLPDLIISSFNDSNEESTKTQYIVETVRSIDAYEPLIITFNNPSTSKATQKAFAYFNMMTINSIADHSLIFDFAEKFRASDKCHCEDELMKFTELDVRKLGYINIDIEVTSLTEREITFITKHELPVFSNIKVDEPCELYAIIVPTFTELEAYPNRFHYIALFHSCTHKDKQLLRRFVNQSIFEHPEEFKYIPAKIEHIEHQEQQAQDSDDFEVSKEVKDETPSKLDMNKREIKGKSKL